MTLDQIKAEMRRMANSISTLTERDRGCKIGIEICFKMLDKLEPEDASLRRVREKVAKRDLGKLVPITYDTFSEGYNLGKQRVLAIIDAELTKKEQKVEKKKQKIEIEVPEGCEFLEIKEPKVPDYMRSTLDINAATNVTTYSVLKELVFRPIEPPLELETDRFARQGKVDWAYIAVVDQKLELKNLIYSHLAPAEARDLAKILTYWADNGKLTERVVVKNN